MFDMWSSVTSKLEAQTQIQSNIQQTNLQNSSSGSIKGKYIISKLSRTFFFSYNFSIICKQVFFLRRFLRVQWSQMAQSKNIFFRYCVQHILIQYDRIISIFWLFRHHSNNKQYIYLKICDNYYTQQKRDVLCYVEIVVKLQMILFFEQILKKILYTLNQLRREIFSFLHLVQLD